MKEQLQKLGLELPAAAAPGGNYASVNIRGNTAYIAIQFTKKNGEFLYLGRLGENISTEDGYKAMQLCALNVLAQIDKTPGISNIVGLNHFDAYYKSTEQWDEAPKIVNGASDLFLNVLGERGTHSRAIFGVHHLPKNFCAGITATFTVK